MEIRQDTQQSIRVGVLLAKRSKMSDPLTPVTGAQLNWYYWTYITKPDGTVINITGYPWIDIPNNAGCYYLQLSETDTDQLGHLMLYIHDASSLDNPVLQTFYIVNQNEFDSKYDKDLLKVEQFAATG